MTSCQPLDGVTICSGNDNSEVLGYGPAPDVGLHPHATLHSQASASTSNLQDRYWVIYTINENQWFVLDDNDKLGIKFIFNHQ